MTLRCRQSSSPVLVHGCERTKDVDVKFKKPNWDDWTDAPAVTLWAAVALALDMDPDDPQVEEARDGKLPPPSEEDDIILVQKFQKYLADAASHRALADGNRDEPNLLIAPTYLPYFSATALQYGWPLSEHFPPPYEKLRDCYFEGPAAQLCHVVAASIGIRLTFLGKDEKLPPHLAKRFRLPDEFSERYRIAEESLLDEHDILPCTGNLSGPEVRFSDFEKFAKARNWQLPEKFPRPVTKPRSEGKWPWGNYETKLLRDLAAAAQELWKAYEPGHHATAPTNEDVQEFLRKRGVPKRKAQIMAQILRADGLPPGPHVERG